MAFVIHDVDQRSDEWRQLRLGCVTGSCAHDFQAKTQRGEWTTGRRNLRTKLVIERLTQRPQEDVFFTRDMQRGVEHEPVARSLYEAQTGSLTRRIGFLRHPTMHVGASPDGLVGDAGSIEVKCPRPAIHWDFIRTQKVPPEYQSQCRHLIWLADLRWCDYVSYCGEFPEPLQLSILRITMTDAERLSYGQALKVFLDEVDAEYAEAARLMMRVVAA